MNQTFVKAFFDNASKIRESFRQIPPSAYSDIVKAVVDVLPPELPWQEGPDPERIHQINDGDYQGVLVFVIACRGYQPSKYWSVMIDYGSCSGCDTLERIRGYGDSQTTEQQLDDYMTLALHIVQGISEMNPGV